MATEVWDNAFLSIGGTDMSSHIKSLSFNYQAAELDDTAMGDDTRSRKGGLKDWSFTVAWHEDFAAGQVDATMFPLVGTNPAIIARPDTAAVGAANPQFAGTGFIPSYGFGGSVGDLLPADTSILAAGTLARTAV